MAGTVKQNKKQICTARIFTNLKHPVEKKERNSRRTETKKNPLSNYHTVLSVLFRVNNKCPKKEA